MSVSAYDHDHSYMAPPHPSTPANATVVQRQVQPQRVVPTAVKGTNLMRTPVVQARPIVGQVWRTAQSHVYVSQNPGLTYTQHLNQSAVGTVSRSRPVVIQQLQNQQQQVVVQRPQYLTKSNPQGGGYVYQQQQHVTYTVGGQQQSAQNFSNTNVTTSQSYTAAEQASNSTDAVTYENSASSLNLVVPIREPSPEPVQEEPVEPAVQDPSTSEANEEYEEEEDGEIDIQIRNVVCNYTLPLHIDLRKLALHSNNVTFDRGRGVLLKQKRKPNCYVKIYSSGKVYIVGCKSEADCMLAARTIARRVQKTMNKLNDTVRIRNYKVCNVLATCRMPFGIKIEELAQQYPAQSQYEPELSVGLVWRSQDPKATLRIHTTGSITVTGASSESDVMRSIEMMYPIVRKFRCAMRHRSEPAKRKIPPRKRAALSSTAGPSSKRLPPVSGSGIVGNKMYFSDEDDIYDEDDLLDDED